MPNSFMIGCGGDFTPEYPVGDTVEISSSGVTRRTFPEAWRDKNIVAFKINLSVRIINDPDGWGTGLITNHRTKDVNIPVAPQLEVIMAYEIAADRYSQPYYTFRRVNKQSKFWLWNYDIQAGIRYGIPPTDNIGWVKDWNIVVDWDIENKYFEVSTVSYQIININWEPIFA